MGYVPALTTPPSLSEGFFIQVLFASLLVTLFLLALPCWFFFRQMTILTMLIIVVSAYYIIGYKQLFGYGLWGSLWRLVFVFGFVYRFSLLLAHLAFFMGLTPDIQVQGYTLPAKIFMIGFHVLSGTLILGTGYLINRIATRKARRQQKR